MLFFDYIKIKFIINNQMSRKQKGSGLGKALINKLQRKRFVGTGQKAPIFYQETQENEADKKKQKMQSVLEQNSLTQYLQIAQMSQQDFHANRNIRFRDIREQLVNKKIISNQHKGTKPHKNANLNAVLVGLQVPRRPNWQKGDTKQALQKLQNQAYLNWRRKLAEIEQGPENLQITPYQKNIQVWRQLWRVVERVDVLVQIIDGRNPLFFNSDDLFNYAREVGKSRFMLVINKSDLVGQKVREEWNQYFNSLGIDHCFFTAKEGAIVQGEQVVQKNSSRVLSPHQLVVLFQQFLNSDKAVEIGLTGYPNVGKSSVINAVLGRKKVGVASMPGKTKHFQTLKLTEEVTLCDCPGLVFPKVHQNKAQMILNGLYPIDTLKQFEQSLQLVAFRVNRQVIQNLYSIHWKENEPYDGQSILEKYARLKGFFTGSGLPNRAKAARYILKDYVNGVLVYNHPAPIGNNKQATFEERQAELEQQKLNFEKEELQIEENLDENFFQKEELKARNVEEVVSSLSQEDFLDIVEGRKVEGLKVTKQMRKDIKFGMKRGAKVQELRKYLTGAQASGHKLWSRTDDNFMPYQLINKYKSSFF